MTHRLRTTELKPGPQLLVLNSELQALVHGRPSLPHEGVVYLCVRRHSITNQSSIFGTENLKHLIFKTFTLVPVMCAHVCVWRVQVPEEAGGAESTQLESRVFVSHPMWVAENRAEAFCENSIWP